MNTTHFSPKLFLYVLFLCYEKLPNLILVLKSNIKYITGRWIITKIFNFKHITSKHCSAFGSFLYHLTINLYVFDYLRLFECLDKRDDTGKYKKKIMKENEDPLQVFSRYLCKYNFKYWVFT